MPLGSRANRNAPRASGQWFAKSSVHIGHGNFRAGTTAPLSSDTLPPKLAVVYWANSKMLPERMQANARIALLEIMEASI